MLEILLRLQEQLEPTARRARVADICVGAHWTVAVMELDGRLRGGISGTGGPTGDHHRGGEMPVRQAGQLLDLAVTDWLDLLSSSSPTERSIGLATLNALLDVDLAACREVNAEQVILERGAGRKVAFVGHFPFVDRVRARAAMTWVFELDPHEGDLPAERIPDFLPQADVIAITGATLLNDTFESIITYRDPQAYVLLLGGTAPLSPVFFSCGVDLVAGTYLEDPLLALRCVCQGATFKQIRGKRLLTLARSSQ